MPGAIERRLDALTIAGLEMLESRVPPAPWRADSDGILAGDSTQRLTVVTDDGRADAALLEFLASIRNVLPNLLVELDTGIETVSASELSALEASAATTLPLPWQSYIEDRDVLGGSSFISTGAEDLYVSSGGRVGTTAALDFLAAARTHLADLLADIRELRDGRAWYVLHPIFSFGTLQLEQVQRELFGRAVETTPDVLRGARLGVLKITDPEVIRASGSDEHPALIITGDLADSVAGGTLDVTAEELAAADHYERVGYRRIQVTLESGIEAWVYVPRASGK